MAKSQSPSPPEPLQAPHESHEAWLLRRIWNKVNTKNEHFMGVIVGEEGSGKSLTSIRLASELDPTFNADRVIFDVGELLKILRDGDHEPGQFYVLDEAGVQLGNRTWQDRSQILANQALQLIRDHNLGLLFTLPRVNEMDSQAQGRLQAIFELDEKVDGEYVAGPWFFLDHDRRGNNDEPYTWMPRRRVNGRIAKIRKLKFGPPDPEIVEPYEERKSEFQRAFYDKTIEKIEEGQADDEEVDEGPSVEEIAEEIVDGALEEVVSTHNQTKQPYVDKDLIRIRHDLSHADAQTVKSLVEAEVSDDELDAVV